MSSFEQCPLSAFNLASLVNAALAYAAAGIPVFPLKPHAKQPLLRGSFQRATTNPCVIRRWWHDTPQANIGIACGEPSDWWVLDIDPRHGGLASLVQLQQDVDHATADTKVSSFLFATRRQLTGGSGAHLFFRRRADLVGRIATTTNWAGYAGIDVRGDRSYITVAPSVHPTGGIYQWQNDLPLVPFPTELVALVEAQRSRQCWRNVAARTPPQSPQSADHVHAGPRIRHNEPHLYFQYALSQAMVGQRNRFACYLACRLVEDVELDWDGAMPWMLNFVANVSQEDHPYTEREALSALHWAFKQAQIT